MSRSKWKANVFNANLIIKFSKKNISFLDKNIYTRSSTIPSNMVGHNVYVHNGFQFKNILVTREKVGFKYGDLVHTRKKHIFKKKLTEKKKIKK
jgi:ribosomal protein S19